CIRSQRVLAHRHAAQRADAEHANRAFHRFARIGPHQLRPVHEAAVLFTCGHATAGPVRPESGFLARCETGRSGILWEGFTTLARLERFTGPAWQAEYNYASSGGVAC